LFVPSIEFNKIGPTKDFEKGVKIPQSKIYFALDSDTSDIINKQLQNKKHIIFTPGIYHFDKPLNVTFPNTVLIGIGMATLTSTNGNVIINVGDVDGVRITAVLLDAGNKKSETLLRWGSKGKKSQKNAKNPGFLQDVFCRVGGPYAYKTNTGTMIELNQNHVVIDNIWLWTADHGNDNSDAFIGYGKNSCENGIVVNGDNVSAHGLMVEHNDGDNVVWNGDNGTVVMFQSEFRYDLPPSKFDVVSFRLRGNNHNAYGIGAYCFFNQNKNTYVNNGFFVESQVTKSYLTNIITVWLNGDGYIKNVINDTGGIVQKPNIKGKSVSTALVCNYRQI
jgi:hypothetical protein